MKTRLTWADMEEDEGSQEESPRMGWELDHSPLTIEGQIESYGRFARGALHTGGWRGRLARLLITAYLLYLAVTAVIGVIQWFR